MIPNGYSSIKEELLNEKKMEGIFLNACFNNSSSSFLFKNLEAHKLYNNFEYFRNNIDDDSNFDINNIRIFESEAMSIKRLFLSNFEIYLKKNIKEKILKKESIDIDLKSEIIKFDSIIKNSIKDFNKEELVDFLDANIFYNKEKRVNSTNSIFHSDFYIRSEKMFLSIGIKRSENFESFSKQILDVMMYKDTSNNINQLNEKMRNISTPLSFKDNFYFNENSSEANKFANNFIKSDDHVSGQMKKSIFMSRLDYYKETGFRKLRKVFSKGTIGESNYLYIDDNSKNVLENIFYKRFLTYFTIVNIIKIISKKILAKIL